MSDEPQNQKRLLVVDDEKSLRSLFSMALEQDDHIVETCCDGFEALQAVQRADFDLILLDIRMPRLDGLSFLKQLRERGNRARVIVCSAELDLTVYARSIAMGVVTFISKPPELVAFRKTVQAHLSPPEPNATDRALRLAEEQEFSRAADLLASDHDSVEKSARNLRKLWFEIFKKLAKGDPANSLTPWVRKLVSLGAFGT